MTDTIEDKILNKMKKCGRGSVFFIPDFVLYGNRNAINKALERLWQEINIRGVCCCNVGTSRKVQKRNY